jgi:hypothetical protein
MKKTLFLLIVAMASISTSVNASNDEYGVYRTKEDFENHRISIIGVILSSENYNVGELNVQLKDRKIIKIDCSHENYFGFRYIDGHDYLRIDAIYARTVVIGNVNLLMSPKGDFKVDDQGHYSFIPAPNGSLSYYFIKDLSTKKSEKFERLISDDKGLMEKYKNDKLGNGDVIQKQLKYLEIYNSTYHVAKKKAKSKKKKKHK